MQIEIVKIFKSSDEKVNYSCDNIGTSDDTIEDSDDVSSNNDGTNKISL